MNKDRRKATAITAEKIPIACRPSLAEKMMGVFLLFHVIRNAGGVVTDDVIRSLTISQRLLGTREIMLIHHTDCGMLTFSDDDLKQQILDEIGIKPMFAMEAFGDLDADVRQSITRVKASPYIPHKEQVRGFVYEVESGQLREVT